MTRLTASRSVTQRGTGQQAAQRAIPKGPRLCRQPQHSPAALLGQGLLQAPHGSRIACQPCVTQNRRIEFFLSRRRCFCDLAFSQRCCCSVILLSRTIQKAGKGNKPLTWTLAGNTRQTKRCAITCGELEAWHRPNSKCLHPSTQPAPRGGSAPSHQAHPATLSCWLLKGGTFQHPRTAVPTTHAETDCVTQTQASPCPLQHKGGFLIIF